MRRKEIDWLRNGAVLMLFLYHTAVVFDPFSDNYVKSAVKSDVAGGFILATFFWYMPLLFFLAGASARFSLGKRTNRQYIKERLQRLLIPFVFGLIFLIPPQGYLAKLWRGIPTGGYLRYWGSFFTHVTDLSGYDGNLTPAHLWFILFLFVISIALLPLLRFFEKKRGKYFLFRIKPVLLSGWSIPIAAVLLLFVRAIPAAGDKNIFYFGLIYVFGAVVYGDLDYIRKAGRFKARFVMGILVLYPLFLWLEYRMYRGDAMLWLKAAEALVTNFMMIFAVLALVGYGTKYLNRGGAALAYLNKACLPVYILHQTILVACAYFVLKVPVPMSVQALLILVPTVALTFALYEVIRRVRPLRFVFGMK